MNRILKLLNPFNYFFTISLFTFFTLGSLNAQDYESDERVACFDGDKAYHFKAVYIDNKGDTITQEKMILKPLGRPWLPQPWLQVALRYIYHTDTSAYKNYKDPEKYFHERNKKYYAKKGDYLYSPSETTGGIAKKGVIYMHPPRTNQYRILQFGPHPLVYTKLMTDTVQTYSQTLQFIGMGGKMMQEYSVSPMQDTTLNNSKVKAWKVSAISGGDFNDYHESQDYIDSTLEAIVTKEYGFIKMHYAFENNTKIQFDLEKVKTLN